MTIHDPERQWAKPVEEVAKAISASPAWPAVFEPGASVAAGRAAIAKLRDLGFLNDQFFVALKAEQKSNAAEPLSKET